jgi:lysophospholipase L1-like esterase
MPIMTGKFLLLATFVGCLFLFSFTGEKKKKIVFFGDSITQMGVDKGGYIDLIKQDITSKGLAEKYDIVGAGIGGNKIYDLYLRMEKDVLDQHPDVVVIWVGVNDVWHKASHGTGTDYDKFGKFYEAVVKKLQANGIQVILTTPAAIGERNDFSNTQDGDLNMYSNWIRKYAADNKLGLVDLRKTFHDYSVANNPTNEEAGILTTDRVHLNAKGNAFVAEQMWNAIK